MANPSGTHHQDANHASSSFRGANPNNGHGNSGPESSGTGMKHNPGISTHWSQEELAILQDGLAKYAAESSIIRYAKISTQLQNKTARDVALRCRWMTKKENSKRRKEDNLPRKSKDKKERVDDLSVKASHSMGSPNILPYATPMIPMDYDDGISYKALSGVTEELLEQNTKALNQISANLSTMQLQENVSLLCQTRDNILKIMNELNDVPNLMKQMPPLPVKLNEELANTILPRCVNFP
ncbi:hypothetical protein P3X46_010220 [Hevea brasiliensis]|uniref:Myb-like domain-containing protein n=1 Tax=Hevea brasiliensis TaxID=3981 RepID=A0ABQ9MHF5_HEVBR|nr:uncharacterized protein LOC110643663 isoform X2 [Hevea brasiliensis]KAJ9178329.1 hypothetical protein P3X46_010220 [Hevea brasiliensis]